jgi:DnaK suppressor protein
MATKTGKGKPATQKVKAKEPTAKKKVAPTPSPATRVKEKPSATRATPVPKKNEKKLAGVASRYDEIRSDLARQKIRLLAEAGLSEDGVNMEEALPDLGDRASAESDQTFSLRLLERGQKLTKKIEEALERIENGTFGICEVCSGEIAFRRLKARPVTTLCIDCKTEQEHQEKMQQ